MSSSEPRDHAREPGSVNSERRDPAQEPVSESDTLHLVFLSLGPEPSADPEPGGLPLAESQRALLHAIIHPGARSSRTPVRWTRLGRPAHLMRLLRTDAPAIVHISDPDREPALDRREWTEALVETLGRAQGVSVLVLAGCDLEPGPLAQVTHCVVSVPRELPDAAALVYLSDFYRALRRGSSVARAHDQGTALLASFSSPVAAFDVQPVLRCRPDVDADRVFLVGGDRTNGADPAGGRRVAPASVASPGVVRRTARLPAAAFWVSSAPATQITIYDGAGALAASGDGMLRVALAPGLYRVHFRRFGIVRERIVDHGRFTDLRDDGPPLVTPAPVTGAVSSHDDYAAAASRFSTEDTCAPLGQPATSRLFIYVRRRAPDDGPRHVPSEPVTLHDVNGRAVMALDESTSHVDPALGHAACSIRVAPGTYRLRAGRSRRDLAITIPPGRAAQVFLADRGSVALDDARVSLVDLDRPFDPANPGARAIEDALLALRSPHATLPPDLRELPAQAWEDDLCLGIAVAHLAWRSRDVATLERVLDRLRRHDAIPDIAILCHAASPSPHGTAASALSAPPLFLASLTLALTAPEFERFTIEASSAVEQATRSKYLDSIWCTWSARAWDERWIEPTVDALRHQRPSHSMESLSRRLCLLPRTVARALADLDAAPVAVGDSPPRRIIDVLDESDAPMELDAACRVVLDALGELSALHHQRAAHLGIEPGTVLLHGDGRASLADPGSWGPLPRTDPAGLEPSMANRSRFAPPEQLRHPSRAGPASDIWAMAATLYFMLTLELPREIYADQSERQAALTNPVVPVRERRPDLPEALAACINRALATAPEARPQDATAFRDELAAALATASPTPATARPEPTTAGPTPTTVDPEPTTAGPKPAT